MDPDQYKQNIDQNLKKNNLIYNSNLKKITGNNIRSCSSWMIQTQYCEDRIQDHGSATLPGDIDHRRGSVPASRSVRCSAQTLS